MSGLACTLILFEILCEGPTILQVQKLQDEVNKLKESRLSQRSFFVLPALQRQRLNGCQTTQEFQRNMNIE
jgi:hypothetical protein